MFLYFIFSYARYLIDAVWFTMYFYHCVLRRRQLNSFIRRIMMIDHVSVCESDICDSMENRLNAYTIHLFKKKIYALAVGHLIYKYVLGGLQLHTVIVYHINHTNHINNDILKRFSKSHR